VEEVRPEKYWRESKRATGKKLKTPTKKSEKPKK
jgi:hypothetical protein